MSEAVIVHVLGLPERYVARTATFTYRKIGTLRWLAEIIFEPKDEFTVDVSTSFRTRAGAIRGLDKAYREMSSTAAS